jgi:hypothetical protein
MSATGERNPMNRLLIIFISFRDPVFRYDLSEMSGERRTALCVLSRVTARRSVLRDLRYL